MGEEALTERLGNYRIVSELGRGGMATVYLAERVNGDSLVATGEQVAVKLMHRHLEEDPEWANHLRREGLHLAKVDSSNVVNLREICQDEEGLYLVLEYVDGMSLSALLHAARSLDESVPMRVVGRILSDVLRGLAAVHDLSGPDGKPLKMVHRDVSPQNILIGKTGVVKLTDFGIAKATGDKTTATGVLKGKLGYMAPEQVTGSRPEISWDLWSTAVVAWELLTERRLHLDKNDATVLLKIASEAPPPPSEVAALISGELDEVIVRSLSLEQHERYQSADEFRIELERVWRGEFGIASTDQVAQYVTSVATRAHGSSHSRLKAPRGEAGATVRAEPVLTSDVTVVEGPVTEPRADDPLRAPRMASRNAPADTHTARPAEGETTTLVYRLTRPFLLARKKASPATAERPSDSDAAPPTPRRESIFSSVYTLPQRSSPMVWVALILLGFAIAAAVRLWPEPAEVKEVPVEAR